MPTISIVSQKGGSGKTTTALNLAVAAHEAGKAVLVVDLDPQASATSWHRVREDKEPHVQPTHQAALSDLIQVAGQQGVDWVIVDTAAQTDSNAAGAIEVSDLVLITCRPSVMDLRAIQNSIRLCKMRDAVPHVLLTQVDAHGAVHDEARVSLEKMGIHVLKSSLGRRVAFQHSLIDGRAVQEYDPRGKAAGEIRALYGEIRHLLDRSSSKQSRRKGTKKR